MEIIAVRNLLWIVNPLFICGRIANPPERRSVRHVIVQRTSRQNSLLLGICNPQLSIIRIYNPLFTMEIIAVRNLLWIVNPLFICGRIANPPERRSERHVIVQRTSRQNSRLVIRELNHRQPNSYEFGMQLRTSLVCNFVRDWYGISYEIG